MHCKKLVLFICGLLIMDCCLAQQSPSSWKFHSINQVGLLEGEDGTSWQLQTINGVQHKSWFGGIGAGLDYYRIRGVPLFLDIRKTFGHSRNKPFVYIDGGMEFTWPNGKEKTIEWQTADFSNGLYLDGGAGYQIHIARNSALLISAGYSYKTVKATTPIYYYGIPMPLNTDFAPTTANAPLHTTYNYYLSRLSIKLGWRF